MPDLLYLDETQNQAFDAEYHLPFEMDQKLRHLRAFTGNELAILDVGGGNGHFLDEVLDELPSCRGTLVDISPALVNINKPHPRKSLIVGNVADLDREFPPHCFDIITINWLLHHLVSSAYHECGDNCRMILTRCRTLLKDGGIIVVAENMFDGYFGTNLPSRIIYLITRVRSPWFVAIARKFFNTAGVGVCFRSRRAWQHMFASAGFRIVRDDPGYVWQLGRKHKMLYALLGLRQVSHRHFYLRPEADS